MSSGYSSYLNATNSNPDYADAVPANASLKTKGYMTWMKVKVLGESKFIYKLTLYDDKGRVLQLQTKNYNEGIDVETNQYSFNGQILRTHLRHQKAGGGTEYNIGTRNSYDAMGRAKSVEKIINGNGWKTVSSLEYNELGQLKTKKLGHKPGTSTTPVTPLANLEFDYNIRGWMLSINKNYTTASDNTGDKYFSLELGYDKNGSLGNFGTSQYNGNIAGALWKSEGDGEKRKFNYSYDAANRLTGASFGQYDGSAFNTSAGLDFSVSGLTYDYNGNIKTKVQKGWKPGGSIPIDDLTYAYKNNDKSNRLTTVTESSAIHSINHKLGDFTDKNRTDDDYDYDANGNLIFDKNKDISSITYNHLNLPGTITFAGNRGISYIYDATGNKLKKMTTEGSNITTTLYMTGVYENEVLQYIPHEEGRMRWKPANNSFQWDYFIKDHLGNVRMVLTEEQQTNAYPAVSFEDANLPAEQTYFENVDVGRTAKPASSTTEKAQLLRKSTTAVGAGKLIKVMAGDKLHVQVDYYTPNDATDNTTSNGVNSVLSSLTSLLNGSTAPQPLHGYGSTVSGSLNSDNIFTTFLSPQTTSTVSSQPKAYLNILFFDEQFKFVQQGSEIVQITTKGNWFQLQRILSNAKQAKKNGYAYVYISNESNNMIYFDNLQLSHERGAILEETHYYPFGLTMAGISSKAAGSQINKRKFNYGSELQSGEFSDGSGLEMYDTKYRGLDPQLGRWWQIDPHAEYHLGTSPYAYVLNNPLIYIDPFGLDTVKANVPIPPGAKPGQVIDVPNSGGGTSSYIYDPNNPNAVNGLVENGESKVLEGVVVGGKSTEQNNTSGYSFPVATLFGTGLSMGSHLMHNNKGWYSLKQNKFYSPNFHGNQYTGGRVKVAKTTSVKLNRLGFGLGLYNAYDINVQYSVGNIGQTQMIAEQGSNVISTFGGIYGAAWGVGWELGRGVTSIPWYRANIRPLVQDAIGAPRDEYPKYPMLDKLEND